MVYTEQQAAREVIRRAHRDAAANSVYLSLEGLPVVVEQSGGVLAWDDIAEHYTRHHALTGAEVAEMQRLAALVRDGTHYAAAGRVWEKVV